jgi:hypothetical protein
VKKKNFENFVEHFSKDRFLLENDGEKKFENKNFFLVLMWPSIINKISEHKFQSLLYGTSNKKFQNVCFVTCC